MRQKRTFFKSYFRLIVPVFVKGTKDVQVLLKLAKSLNENEIVGWSDRDKLCHHESKARRHQVNKVPSQLFSGSL